MDGIYLDYNASTPIDKEVADFMIPYLRGNFGNPSSTHQFGIQTKKAIELARTHVANLIHCSPLEIIFTSGGTESNNFAIQGIAFANRDKGNHIITSSIEHPAVLEVCKFLETNGFEVSYVGVDHNGRIDPDSIRSAVRPSTILISIMHANNETGSIQPIAEISEITREYKIPFHTDAAQSVGKIEVYVNRLGVDLLSIAGHKFYAPKGVGALYVREGTGLSKILHGANHEHNMRPGTENVLEIAGLGKAAEIALRDLDKNALMMKQTRDLLYQEIKKSIPEIVWNGDPENILPNTLSLSFPGLDSNTLLSELSEIAASTGAACHADDVEISNVLRAMDVPAEMARGTIRFSTGKYTSDKEIRKAAELIVESARKLMSPVKGIIPDTREISSIKLTQYTHGLGCACKISPAVLEEVLKKFPALYHRDILVGPDTSDDAAVYRINENQAIVQTVDFFTPVVDDPFEFGAIAASNALSDIYAMGATPLFALNIVAFPTSRLPLKVLHDILAGAKSVANEAGIFILGGHTIEDYEPKFGMVVSGLVHPDRVIRNSTALTGHLLVLTKPIGTGVLSTALKRGMLDNEQEKALYNNMRLLNRKASEIMLKYRVSACTDITGFGLTGHLKEMIESSGKGAEIIASHVPVLPGAYDFAAQGLIPGGTRNNLNFVESIVNYSGRISESLRILLSDAQTSGGLLIAIASEDTGDFIQKIKDSGNNVACVIGKITSENRGQIRIIP
jgi:cysteine desulfurase